MQNELQPDTQLLWSKSSALDIVVNVAHTLFSILDSEYAEHMSDTIKQVNENESYLSKLSKKSSINCWFNIKYYTSESSNI